VVQHPALRWGAQHGTKRKAAALAAAFLEILRLKRFLRSTVKLSVLSDFRG